MKNTRRELMILRDKALAAGDIAAFQSLTIQIAKLSMKNGPKLTAKDITKYVFGKAKV
jgi:hypothetical protein